MTDFDIVPLDPTDHDLVQSWLALRETVREYDQPGLPPWNPMRPMMSLVQHRSDGVEERWLATADGRVLGLGHLSLTTLDNTHLADVDLQVHPDERRRGVGSALLQHLEDRAKAAGRTTMSSWVPVPIPGGPPVRTDGAAFAESRGFASSLECVVRVCDLDQVDNAELERLWQAAWARAEGFEIVPFVGAPPAELLDGMAYMHSRMYTDMPLGEWELQEADIDGARILDWERQRRERGELHLQVAVRHIESGEIAGFTEIIIEGGKEHDAHQGDTIIDPRFRGHRLGTILKIANQRRVREWRPKMKYIWTGNAETNSHMININEAVGYRKSCLENVYQKKLA